MAEKGKGMYGETLWRHSPSFLFQLLHYGASYRDVDESRLEAVIPVPLLRWAERNVRPFCHFCSYMRERVGIPPLNVEVFSRDRHRLLLFHWKDIEESSKYVGALLKGEEINKIVHRVSRDTLKLYLGEAIYDFVVKRFPLYRPFVATFDLPEECRTDSPVDNVKRAAQYVVECCFAGSPKELLSRLALKMPPDAPVFNFDRVVNAEQSDRVFKWIKRLLDKEMAHPLAPCLS